MKTIKINESNVLGCGGVAGFLQLMDITLDPNHEEHAEKIKWLESRGYHNYHPGVFLRDKVVFDYSMFE